ncbi:MAG TPA: SDR family NAD(P)-dependent oxidoreductase [Methylomirabilota bacterium]|nr:SDR family NAD(P)-dependent oxidoreductase [Methylomirabilota bacterium]
MQDLAGKVAVITGGASGIGLATARSLAREKMRIVLADIEQGPLDTAVAEIQGLGGECLGVKTDVGDLTQVQALADRTWERFGGAQLVFNNAGVAVFGPIQEMKHADWEWVIRVDLWGVIHGVEAFVPRMIAQNQGGHIVNTASFAGLVPNQGLGVYCVAKYGVVALTECIARDLKPHGIGASVLCPMILSTNINRSERNRPAEPGGAEARRRQTSAEQQNMRGRVLPPELAAEKVVKAVKNNELYIHTHEEAREFIRRRFERIDKAFES